MIGLMTKKQPPKPKPKVALDAHFPLRLEPSLLEEIKAEVSQDPDRISINTYIRRLLRTHPDRPANKKK